MMITLLPVTRSPMGPAFACGNETVTTALAEGSAKVEPGIAPTPLTVSGVAALVPVSERLVHAARPDTATTTAALTQRSTRFLSAVMALLERARTKEASRPG